MTIDELRALIDSADVTFACVHGGATRCWPCQTDGCYDTPTVHPWWDADDAEHAANTGQEPPTGVCGCAFCGGPALTNLTQPAEEPTP